MMSYFNCLVIECFTLHYGISPLLLTLKVFVATIDAQWEGMGDVGQRGTSRHYFPHA